MPTKPVAKQKTGEALSRVFSIDLRALALVRIFVGLLLLIDIYQRLHLTELFYGPGNIYPAEAARLFRSLPLSVHMLSDALWFQYGLRALAAMFALTLILGWKSRTSAALSFLLLTSLHMRLPDLQDAGDDLLRYLLLWGMFLPLGACWSIDNRKSPFRERGDRVLSFASAGMLLQVFLVFQIAGLAKLHGESWVNGQAIQIVMHDLHFVRAPGVFLQQFPTLMVFLDYLTLVIEIFAPFLLLWPGRKLVRHLGIVLLASLIIAFGLCIQIDMIPPTILVSLIPFLPSELFAKFLKLPQGIIRKHESDVDSSFITTLIKGLYCKAIPLVLVIFMLLAGYNTVQPVHLMPPRVYRLGKAFGLLQGWWMYAPEPGVGPSTITFTGWKESDETVEFKLGISHTEVEELPEAEILWSDTRPRRFLYNRLLNSLKRPDSVFMLSWLCRQWNERYPDDQIKKFSMRLDSPTLDIPDVSNTFSAYRCGSALTIRDLEADTYQ